MITLPSLVLAYRLMLEVSRERRWRRVTEREGREGGEGTDQIRMERYPRCSLVERVVGLGYWGKWMSVVSAKRRMSMETIGYG